MGKLTKRLVEGLKPEPDRQAFRWDGELRGFGVCVKPSGAKSYVIQYRTLEGRSRRVVIGQAGALTPEEAHDLARQKLAAVARGEDPAAERQAARAAATVADICDWYLAEAEAGTLLGRRGRPIKASTLAMDRSRIDTHVRPLLGRRTVRGLTLEDIERFQGEVAAGKTARPRGPKRGGVATGGAGSASRTVSMLHTILEHALRRKRIEANPARGVRKLAPDKKRDRHLTVKELAVLGRAMREAEADFENRTGLAAVRLLLLTGFRRMEVLGLRHDWVNADKGCVRFPDTKSGPQIRLIGKAALSVIRTAPRRDDSPFVFPAEQGDGHFIGVVRVLDRLCARAKLTGVSPHVLRHTFASVAAEMGFTELTVAALLGHASRGVTQRYIHLDEAIRVAADRVSERVEALLKEKVHPGSPRRRREYPETAEVVHPSPARRR